MRWAQLTCENFRNFVENKFQLTQKTLVIGLNGSGKSNFIEALRLLTVGKSFKTNHLDEAINFSGEYFRLSLEIEEEKRKKVEFFYGKPFKQSDKIRQLLVDGQGKNWGDFWGELPSVLYNPKDIDLVSGGPVERRRYLDGALWQLSPQNRFDLLEMNKILRERSALLYLVKTNQAAREDLKVWADLLISKTSIIRQRRIELIEYFKEVIKDFLAMPLSSSLKFEYCAHRDDQVPLEDEIRFSQNLIGAQKDRLNILIDGKNSRQYASRGQSRLIALLLRLLEARMLERTLKKPPLLLMDDLMSEIDKENLGRIFPLLERFDKVVISTIEKEGLSGSWQEIILKNA